MAEYQKSAEKAEAEKIEVEKAEFRKCEGKAITLRKVKAKVAWERRCTRRIRSA